MSKLYKLLTLFNDKGIGIEEKRTVAVKIVEIYQDVIIDKLPRKKRVICPFKKYKGQFIDQIDDAQYLMLMILHKYNISSLKVDHFESLLKGSFNNIHGILIGNISNMYGDFEFYLNGVVAATNAEGEIIDTAEEYKKYLLEERVLDLHFDSRAYIFVLNKNDVNKYYGVFERLGDAIKVAMKMIW